MITPKYDPLTLNPSGDFSESAWPHLIQHLPISLAVREIMRLRALFEMGAITKPILDVGCGDGLFWENLIRQIQGGESTSLNGLMGIDIDPHELSIASMRLRSQGGQVLQQDISMTFPHTIPSNPESENSLHLSKLQGHFQSVIANCSLEHVPQLEPALLNIRRFLHPSGQFVLFVPTPAWTDSLTIKKYFTRLSPRLGGLIGGCFDGFFQHRHLYPASVWKFLLEGMGFKVQTILGIGHPTANRLFEAYLPSAFFCFLIKMMTKKYPRFYRRKSLLTSPKIIEFLQVIKDGSMIQSDLDSAQVIEYFIICRK